jgi:tRNA threonylcarbamoyladenosine biosynthesis protein TsaB
MNILALDTAAAMLSLALGTERGSWFFEADAGFRHSELLMDGVDMLMKAAGLEPAALEGVVCLKGPGSFTGLRIGFAAAKGLALSLGIPLAAASTLDCLARPFSVWPGLVLPLLDAKKDRFFTALYRKGRRLSDDMDAGLPAISAAVIRALEDAPAEEKRILLTGPDAMLFQERLAKNPAGPGIPADAVILDPEFRRGRAKILLEIAKNIDIFDNNNDALFSGPEYLRKSDAELLFYPDERLEHDDRNP